LLDVLAVELLDDAAGAVADKRVVHEKERLRRDRRLRPFGAGGVGIGKVERPVDARKIQAVEKAVERASAGLLAENVHLRFAADVGVEERGNREQMITDGFEIEALAGFFPQ